MRGNIINALRTRVSSAGAPLAGGGKNIVAFSGGVDSSLVACLVHQVYPQNSLACVGVSAALPAAQLQLARDVAKHIGIPLTEVATGEGSDPDYVANEGQSCFHCKTHLYSSLEAVAQRAGAESRALDGMALDGEAAATVAQRETEEEQDSGRRRRKAVVLFNGTNKDDKKDPTRVGLKAAADFRVASPIDMLTKAEVRAVSRELGLPNWNHAASPCLRSRLAFGVQATPDRLMVVEQAEELARQLLGLGVSHNLRVRAMHGEKALLEVDDGDILNKAVRTLPEIRSRILALGFEEVDVRAFRSGAVSGGGGGSAKGAKSRVAEAGGVEVSRVVGTRQSTP